MDKQKPGPTRPSLPTTKWLFHANSTGCAFPKCKVPCVDSESGSVIVEICHIEGEKSTAARHRENQINEERHGFENLLLMCGPHHKIIDDDEDSYTVERLKELKADSEVDEVRRPAQEVERVAEALINNYGAIQGSVIVSQNQMGGQVAGLIVNIGQQPLTEHPLQVLTPPVERPNIIAKSGKVYRKSNGLFEVDLTFQASSTSQHSRVVNATSSQVFLECPGISCPMEIREFWDPRVRQGGFIELKPAGWLQLKAVGRPEPDKPPPQWTVRLEASVRDELLTYTSTFQLLPDSRHVPMLQWELLS